MRLILSIITTCFLITGCKKNNADVNTDIDAEACVQGNAVNAGEIVNDQYIIALAAGTSTNAKEREPAMLAQKILAKYNVPVKSLVKSFAGKPGGFVAKLSSQELAKLRSDKSISMIEPDRIIALGNCFTVVAPWLLTWNINKVGYGDGTGKIAWVIDSGIDFEHPDLTVDKTLSKNFVDGLTSATDENGHGTHVAGIIAAKNNDYGVLGVASGATLVSLRVLDKDGEGLLSSIIEALAYINANAKAGDAVNMSVGEDGVSEILDQQVRATAAKGIFISIAAGNDKKPVDQYSPARINAANVYTISAVDSTGRFADFSNYGEGIDYAAPGVHILSTYKEKKYAVMSGTSMAAPHVTGLLLLKGNNLTASGNATDDPDGNNDGIVHN